MSSEAQAQAPAYGPPGGARRGPLDRPVISPYATLSGLSGDDLVREYFRRVRPEVDLRNSASRQQQNIQNLQRQVNQQRALLRQSQTSQLGATGHPTYFLNHRGYFGVGGGR
jgi:hypothetical protein